MPANLQANWTLRPRAAGGTPPLSPQVSQFLSRLAPYPDTTLKGHYITLIEALVTAGVWAKLDCLQIYATTHVGQASINLVSNTRTGNPEVLAGQLGFLSDRGLLSPDNTTRYNTWFEPAAASQNFTLNSGFVGFWSLTSTQISAEGISLGPINSSTTSTRLAITPRWSDNKTYATIAADTDAQNTFTGDSLGWYVIERTAASGAGSVLLSRNTTTTTANITSVGYSAEHFSKLRCRHRTAAFAAGSKLTTPEHNTLYTALQTFLTARGAI